MQPLAAMISTLTLVRESDANMRQRESKLLQALSDLKSHSEHMSGLPKHFVRYGRSFITFAICPPRTPNGSPFIFVAARATSS